MYNKAYEIKSYDDGHVRLTMQGERTWGEAAFNTPAEAKAFAASLA